MAAPRTGTSSIWARSRCPARALLILEAAGVSPDGRISRECLGVYSDANEVALARVLEVVRRYSTMPIGIQLGHAGRKASIRKPGDGRGMVPFEEGGWETVGPLRDCLR